MAGVWPGSEAQTKKRRPAGRLPCSIPIAYVLLRPRLAPEDALAPPVEPDVPAPLVLPVEELPDRPADPVEAPPNPLPLEPEVEDEPRPEEDDPEPPDNPEDPEEPRVPLCPDELPNEPEDCCTRRLFWT